MGITIYNEKTELDCSYIGFFRLRKHIASLISKEFQEFYGNIKPCGDEEYWTEHDRILEEVMIPKYFENNPKVGHGVLDFFFASDCEGEVDAMTCQSLWGLIKNNNEEFVFGYGENGKWSDFKELVEQCVESQIAMRWA